MNAFLVFTASLGLIVNSAYPSDRIQRCPTIDHPKSTNGAYFYDGRKGWAWRWDADARVHWWHDPAAKPWTDTEKRQWADQQRHARQQRERRQRDAAIRASDILRSARPDIHGYLKYKGLPEELGMVLPDGTLFVPMRDVHANQIIGGQTIALVNNEWEKKMLYGQRASGAVLRIGPARPESYVLVEGYATGLSVAAAARQMRLNTQVVVCFSAGNLGAVAPTVAGRAGVFADNDISGTGERAARSTGLPWVMSDTVGHDANDDYKRFGVLTVCQKLMELRNQA